MVQAFQKNKLIFDGETVAEQLRQARQASGYTIEKAAKEVGINVKYLRALEHDDFNVLPAGVYGKNFLREYAQFLCLPEKSLVALYEQEAKYSRKEPKVELFSKQVVRSWDLLATPRLLRNISLALVVAVCMGYLIYSLNRIVAPPLLVLQYPIENAVVDKSGVEIRGSAEPETTLTINGEAVLMDYQGNFAKEVQLKKGINTITVCAEKRYGQKQIVSRQVLVKG
jgi:transcriptional regulator with XRE-family HTH domain